MKDTIYTIPLTDAFKAHDECPFCFIHRKLEEDAISFTLGASYMEDDYRAITDQMGFCRDHYKKLYEYGNRLGLALILQTHYQSVINDLSKVLDKGQLPSMSLLQKLTKAKSSPNPKSSISDSITQRIDSCYICERIEKDMDRYAKTFFHLLDTHDAFKKLFEESTGFCLPHFNLLLDMAPLYLNEELKTYFFDCSRKLLIENLRRLEDDLSWFIDKYDYRNSSAPWKNAKDAIPRGIQKLSGIYVQNPPFKEQN